MELNCKGCNIYQYSKSKKIRCELAIINTSRSCPCTTCIVKVMCSEECTTFRAYYNENMPKTKAFGINRF